MPTRVIIGWDTEYQEVDPSGFGQPPNPLSAKDRKRLRKHKSPAEISYEK